MTIDEAKKVAKTCYTADGGCMNCAGNLLDKLQEDFPEFDWNNLHTEEEKEELRYA